MADPKIHFYESLSTLLEAGVPILRALPTAARTLHGPWRRMAQSIEQDLRQGRSLADSMAQQKRFFEPLEVELVRTGEQTGQLAEIFAQLAQWRQFLQQLKKTFWSGMILPIVILHAAAIVIPLPLLMRALLMNEGSISDFFYSAAGILAFFYVPAIVIGTLVHLTPSQGLFKKMLDAFVCSIPLLGKAVINLSLSRYARTFAMLYRAGVPIVQAAEQATRNCGNWVVQQRLKGAYLNVKKGETMSAGFAPAVDPEFREIWLVGEESGELDQCAYRLGNLYAERAENTMKAFARGFPVAAYLILLGVLAFLVIRGFLSIYGKILNPLDY